MQKNSALLTQKLLAASNGELYTAMLQYRTIWHTKNYSRRIILTQDMSIHIIGRAKLAFLIEISRDIYIYRCCRYVGVCLSYVKLIAWAELRVAHTHAQSLFLAVKPVTPALFISYMLEL